MVKVQRIGKTGKSLYCTIPKAIAEALELKRTDLVAVALLNGSVVIRKVDERELMKASSMDAVGEKTLPGGE